jgi:CheY-like chemotaxis protein
VKILIVDDSVAMQAIVRRGLEQFGYKQLEIKQANNGVEALEIIGNWQPEIVLTDWHMPQMSGIELLIEVKKRELPLKIGLVTTVNDDERIELAIEQGASFVLSKPFEDEALHKALLPLIQGAFETEEILNAQPIHNSDLVLPKLSQLEKVLHRFLNPDIQLTAIPTQVFSNEKIPALLALFEDTETQKVRAVAMLDIKATCLLGGLKNEFPASKVERYLTNKVISKQMLDGCEQVLASSSFAFLDRKTRKNLRLKCVSFVPKTFAKLEILFAKPASERVDILCTIKGYQDGTITIVSS